MKEDGRSVLEDRNRPSYLSCPDGLGNSGKLFPYRPSPLSTPARHNFFSNSGGRGGQGPWTR